MHTGGRMRRTQILPVLALALAAVATAFQPLPAASSGRVASSLSSSSRRGPAAGAAACPSAPRWASRGLRLNAAAATTTTAATTEADNAGLKKDLQTIQGYLNENHGELLKKFAQAFTPLGEEMSKKNLWRGDAMALARAEVEAVDLERLRLKVTVRETGVFGNEKLREEAQEIFWAKARAPKGSGDVLRLLIQMCSQVRDEAATASLYSIPIANDKWAIPNNLFLNNCPHSKFARQFFYNRIVRAVDAAIQDPAFPNRMKISFLIPESNSAFDTYRIGTVLELCRELVFHQINCGKRVKLCVQGKMGTGVFQGLPISLNGCRIIMENMDWSAETGEDYEGIIGTKLFFGEIGGHVVEEEDDVFILISPTNLVGASVVPLLEDMAKAAGDRPFIVLNPNVKDRPSSNNVMQVRGREEREAFASSFATAFAFETLHDKGLFKIIGAVGKAGHDQPWVSYRLEDNQDVVNLSANERREEYRPVRVSEQEPDR